MNANMILKGILHVLFKRKAQVLGFFFATLIVVVPLALNSAKPKFQASTQLRLELGREFISDLRLDTQGAVSPVVRFNADEQLDLAIEILKGHSLAVRVIETMGIETLFPYLNKPGLIGRILPDFMRNDPQPSERELIAAAAELFVENLDAAKTSHSSIINITYNHRDPDISAQAANTLVSLYVDRHLDIRNNARSDQFFREQFAEIKTNLQLSELQLRDFKIQHQISSTVEDEKALLIAQINKLEVQLNEAASKQSEMKTRLTQLESQLTNTAKDPAAIGILKEKLLTLQLKESELALNYNNESRTLDNLRGEISSIQTRLLQLGANKRYGSSAGSTGSLYQNLQADFLKTQADLSATEAREAITGQQISRLKGRLAVLDGLDVEFSHLAQQVKAAKENNGLYLSRFEEMRISNAMDAEKISSISVIEPARVPMKPMKSKLPLQIALAIFVGLVGGIGLAFLLEMLNRTIERREDIETDLGLPVLASVPDFSTR